jgi:RND family efflux transporter MFP subunit
MNWILKLLLGLAFIAACWKAWETVYLKSLEVAAEVEDPEVQPSLAVEVMPARRQFISEEIQIAGSLEPQASIDVRVRSQGYVIELLKDVGDIVEVGDPLARLDDSFAQELIRRSEAALDVAEAELEVQQAELLLAEQTLQRERDLAESGAGARRAIEQAEASVSTATSRIALAEAKIREATATLTEANLSLDELTLTSPVAGVIGRRTVELGDLAKPEDLLMQIVRFDPIITEVHVPETRYHQLRVDLEAIIEVDSYPTPFPGKVTRISPVIDQLTRTALVRIEVQNPQGLLKPGMHARVSISSDAGRMATVVPVSSVIQTGERTSVFVVTEGTDQVREQEVRVGMSTREVTEIVEGVEEGEQIVTLGARIVRNGQTVKVIEVDWPATLAADPESPETEDPACEPTDAESE